MSSRIMRLVARLTPWAVVHWLGSFERWCWADLVGWKLGDGNSLHRLTGCLATEIVDGHARCQCWCGYWDRVNRLNAARILRAEEVSRHPRRV